MKFEVYKDDKNEFRWRLVADNGNIMADSAEGYVNKADAIHGMNVFRNLSKEAEIEVGEE